MPRFFAPQRVFAALVALAVSLAGLVVLPLAPAAIAEPAGPSTVVSVTESSPGSLSLSVVGSGFAPAEPGVYVALGDRFDPVDASVYVKSGWVRGSQIAADGSFTTTLELGEAEIAELDSSKSYSVYTFKAHGQAMADPSQNTTTAVAIDFDSLVEPVGPSTVVSVTESSPGSLSLSVVGSGFAPAEPGVYVALGDRFDPVDASVYVKSGWVRGSQIAADGSFTTTLELGEAEIAELDSSKSYSVYTFKAHGQAMADPSQNTTTAVAIDFDSLVEPSGVHTKVKIARSTPSALWVDVDGEGFSRAGPGIYVGIAPVGTSDTADASKYLGTEYLTTARLGAGGTFSTTLKLDAEEIKQLDRAKKYAVITMKAHGEAADDPSQNSETVLALDFASLGFPTGAKPSTPPSSGNKGGKPGAALDRRAGSLSWGVSGSFRNYVTGNIARGSISVSGGAVASGGVFVFGQRDSNASGANGVGTTSYGGAVTFRGHGGELNLQIADPQIIVSSPAAGTLTAAVGGQRVALASLNLAKGNRTGVAGAVTYTGVPATLTQAGARAFEGFYGAGTAMDPVTFTIGANGAPAGAGGVRTVAAAVKQELWEPPATPPAADGIELTYDGEELTAGQQLTAAATGFQPGETGIKVVVYSDPIVLERELTADPSGRAVWTGLLPDTLEPGDHTLTFQGSVDRGVVFTIADEALGQCAVEEAVLSWGVKESFRAYISGAIANGEWTTSGNATYETPEFTWTDGTGTFEEGRGDIDFSGDVVFTGHNGALDLHLTDPTVRLVDEQQAYIVADVATTEMDAAMSGERAEQKLERIPVVELDLTEAQKSEENGQLVLSEVPATLTSQGAEAFSNYSAGEAFDPVSLTVQPAADCGEAETPVTTADSAPVAAEAESTGTAWWMWAAGVAVLLAAALAAVTIIRRRGMNA